MALFPPSHKTVFVLDHGPYFALPCQSVEYDVGRRAGPGFVPHKPIKKLVWTSAVEAVAEYCRIVWDIFPRGERLIRVVVGEVGSGDGWGDGEQSMPAMMEVVAVAGAASTESRDSNVVTGVRSALELLTRLSPRQMAVTGETVVNRGRVVIVTTLESDARYHQLISAVEQQLTVVNKVRNTTRQIVTSDKVSISNFRLLLVARLECCPWPGARSASYTPSPAVPGTSSSGLSRMSSTGLRPSSPPSSILPLPDRPWLTSSSLSV